MRIRVTHLPTEVLAKVFKARLANPAIANWRRVTLAQSLWRFTDNELRPTEFAVVVVALSAGRPLVALDWRCVSEIAFLIGQTPGIRQTHFGLASFRPKTKRSDFNESAIRVRVLRWKRIQQRSNLCYTLLESK